MAHDKTNLGFSFLSVSEPSWTTSGVTYRKKMMGTTLIEFLLERRSPQVPNLRRPSLEAQKIYRVAQKGIQ